MPSNAGRTRKLATSAPPSTSNRRYVVRVDLLGAKPPIWRRLELAPELRLDQVHDVLQVAFAWTNSHLHEFELPDPDDPRSSRRFGMALDFAWGDPGDAEEIEQETDFSLGQVMRQPGDVLYYTYDFGDGWEHQLKLEKVVEVQPDAPLARCTAGRRAAPLDDSGGIWMYEEMLLASKDRTHPDYQAAAEWMMWAFNRKSHDPDAAFDLNEVKRRVQFAV